MTAMGAGLPGAGPPGAGPPGPNPDDLLMQIKDLLDQYLAMGGDTPVAPEAQALSDAIDSSTGAAGPVGASPADMGAPPPPDASAGPPTFQGARSGAMDYLSKADAQTGKKKKAKAF